MRKDLISQKGSLVALYVKPRKSAKKNIYVIGGSKRELGSAWTRSECTYQTVECFDTFKQVQSRASNKLSLSLKFYNLVGAFSKLIAPTNATFTFKTLC